MKKSEQVGGAAAEPTLTESAGMLRTTGQDFCQNQEEVSEVSLRRDASLHQQEGVE